MSGVWSKMLETSPGKNSGIAGSERTLHKMCTEERKGKMNIILAIIKFMIFGFIWQRLEIKFYGEVQPRIVDDIMSLVLFYYILKGEML